jgi:hypothetical protein
VSILTRPRRLTESAVPSSACEENFEPIPAVPAARHDLSAEAPERAACPREAPESRFGRKVEAPDAGLGRADHHEHEFTHGRSQS